MTKMNRYTITSTQEFVDNLINKENYEAIQLNEGTLGLGDLVLIPPYNAKKYNFVIREVYVNDWASAQTIRRCRKISKALQKEIDKAEEKIRKEEDEWDRQQMVKLLNNNN